MLRHAFSHWFNIIYYHNITNTPSLTDITTLPLLLYTYNMVIRRHIAIASNNIISLRQAIVSYH